MNKETFIGGALLLTMPLTTQAQVAPPPPTPSLWSGEFTAGYLGSQGNTRSSSFNGKAALRYTQAIWRNALTLTAINAYSENVSAAEAYSAADQTDLHFTPRDYAFLALEWNKDRFAAIAQHQSQTLGYGRHVLPGPAQKLDLELGAGARQSQTNGQPREWQRELVGRGAVHYRWAFSATGSLAQDLKLEGGIDNTYVESFSELKLALLGNLYAGFSYTVKFNTQVAEGTRHADTYTAFNLSYLFGTPP